MFTVVYDATESLIEWYNSLVLSSTTPHQGPPLHTHAILGSVIVERLHKMLLITVEEDCYTCCRLIYRRFEYLFSSSALQWLDNYLYQSVQQQRIKKLYDKTLVSVASFGSDITLHFQ